MNTSGLLGPLSKFMPHLIFVLIIVFPSLNLFAQPFGLTQRTTVTGLQFPLEDPGSSQLTRAFPNVTFSQPIFVTAYPAAGNRLAVVEKPGRIRLIVNNDSVTSFTEFLDITAVVRDAGEQGLLGLAFDPDFANNRYFYVFYSADSSPARSVIARYQVNADFNSVNSASHTVILEVPQTVNGVPTTAYSNHKAGALAFGKDGYLYIAVGDGGSGGDPHNRAQDCSEMLGSVLRIDPTPPAGSTTPYSVPADNPYAGNSSYTCGNLTGVPSRLCGVNGIAANQICKEIFACGVRNPWRFSFDRMDGTLWLADVGQGALEEIDIVRSGDNLGWRIFEATNSYNNPENLPASAFRMPIYKYNRSMGYSVTGGYVYRGSQIPSLYGKYIYGDYVSGNIWALQYDNASNAVTSNLLIASLGNLVSFGEDHNGELFAVSIDGALYRFAITSSGTGTIPPTLSQTGLFSNLATLQATSGAIEFDVNAALWSDAALKRRWLLLPGSEKITFSPSDAYNFPNGTAIVKHFELALSPGVNRRLETRVLFKHTQGWAGYTYKWRANGSDADLLTDRLIETYTVQDPNAAGGTRQQTWTYPSRVDCFNCHTASAGRVLGIRTRQLNRNFTYGSLVDNQLRSWNNIGLFTANIGSHSQYEAYPQYADNSQPIENRARAYLAANCAHCHNPGEPRPGVVDLRYEITRAAMNIVGIRPAYGDLNLTDAYRVKAGQKAASVLWERMRKLDSNRMPPLGSALQDQNAITLIGNWIDSIGTTQPPAAPGNFRVQ